MEVSGLGGSNFVRRGFKIDSKPGKAGIWRALELEPCQSSWIVLPYELQMLHTGCCRGRAKVQEWPVMLSKLKKTHSTVRLTGIPSKDTNVPLIARMLSTCVAKTLPGMQDAHSDPQERGLSQASARLDWDFGLPSAGLNAVFGSLAWGYGRCNNRSSLEQDSSPRYLLRSPTQAAGQNRPSRVLFDPKRLSRLTTDLVIRGSRSILLSIQTNTSPSPMKTLSWARATHGDARCHHRISDSPGADNFSGHSFSPERSSDPPGRVAPAT